MRSELQGRLKKELLNMPHRKNVERCPGDDSARLLLLSTAVKDHETLLGAKKISCIATAAAVQPDGKKIITY